MITLTLVLQGSISNVFNPSFQIVLETLNVGNKVRRKIIPKGTRKTMKEKKEKEN